MPRDYYDILGVSRSCDKAALKRAHRKLARQYHPDMNKHADAQERFNEVQEAYDVLSDAKKRKLYDQFGHAGVGAAGAGPPPGQDPFRGRGGGFNFRVDDMQGGEGRAGDLFEQFFGGGGMGPRGATRPPARDIEQEVEIPFDMAVRGGSLNVRMQSGSPNSSIELKIPQGIAHGARLRVRGEGQPSLDGRKSGDLFIKVRVARHPWFRRDGHDLFVEVPISVVEAICGTTVEVPTLTGKATVTVPAGSSHGRRLRLKGAGVKDAAGTTGDLYAIIQVEVPSELPESVRHQFQNLADQLPPPRLDVPWK